MVPLVSPSAIQKCFYLFSLQNPAASPKLLLENDPCSILACDLHQRCVKRLASKNYAKDCGHVVTVRRAVSFQEVSVGFPLTDSHKHSFLSYAPSSPPFHHFSNKNIPLVGNIWAYFSIPRLLLSSQVASMSFCRSCTASFLLCVVIINNTDLHAYLCSVP